MKDLLLITTQSPLADAVEDILEGEPIGLTRVDDWPAAKESLVEARQDVVCIDYEDVKIEGLDSFIQLDNILAKEGATGILLLREPSRRASEFVDNLDSFQRSITYRGREDREALSEALSEALAGPDEYGELHRSLPDLNEGSLADTSIVKLLHTIRRDESSGTLELWTGEIRRRWAFRDGHLLEASKSGYSPRKALGPAFAWSGGQWRFDAGSPPDGEVTRVWPAALKAVYNHVSQRTAMNGLMSALAEYAVSTDHGVELAERLEDEPLEAVLAACDGETTLEKALSSLGANATRGFQAAYFAIECDAVVLEDNPTPAPVTLVYSGESADEPPPTPSSEYDAPQRSISETVDELDETLQRLEHATPYQVFDLWEGCGEAAVRERFYSMVKIHHPDAYGGNISKEAKALAEKVFIKIKRAHTKLMDREDEQTVPPPSERTESQEVEFDGQVDFNPFESSLGESTDAVAEEIARRASHDHQTAEPSEAAQSSPGKQSDSSRATASSPGRGADQRTRSGPRAPMQAEHEAADRQTRSGSGGAGGSRGSGSRNDGRSDEERRKRLDRLRRRSRESTPSSGLDAASSAEERNRKFEDLKRRSEVSMAEASSVVMPKESEADDAEGQQQEAGVPENPLDPADTEEQAKQYFNKGYKAFKSNNELKAFHRFERAHDFDRENGLFKTFYAYLLFLIHPEEKDEARDLLKDAIRSGNRQVLPDAHLFLGRILKVKELHKRAKKHFEKSLDLNPASIEAKRELRVYELRGDKGLSSESTGDSEASQSGEGGEPSFKDDPAGFIKNLLNKDLF